MGQLWLKWMGHLWLKWKGHLLLKWVGNLWLKWVGIYDLNGWGIYDKWVGHLWLKWMGELIVFLGDMLKNTGHQGSTLSGLHMTTGFGPFELLTHGLLQKGQDHSLPKFCFEEPSFWLAHIAMGIDSAMNIQITKQIGGTAQRHVF